jgi:D-alanyl-D-alanine carboxypeptidase (penicillin-binding protein 5/6)
MKIANALLLCLIFAASLVTVPLALAQPAPVASPPPINARAFILQDYHSGHVIAEKASNTQFEPASLTKVMTAYVVFNELANGNIDLDEEVTISEKAWRMPGSRMFVEVDSRVRVEDLIRGMIIQSGNDASVALAEYVAGSEEAFATMMNYYADQLGMAQTNYANASGLPADGHLTTAADMARLIRAMIAEFPQYYGWYSEREFTYNDIRQTNRNPLLWRDPSVDGVKTGHTDAAGYCLSTSAEREGMRLISVVMGSASDQTRADESQALLNYGFRFFETHQIFDAGAAVTEAPVYKGIRDNVSLGLSETLFITLPRGQYSQLKAESDVQEPLIAPISAGQALGSLRLTLGGELLAEHPLQALNEVEQAGWWKRTRHGMGLWISSWFGD